jgi:large-conductance mechanosensitive channel
VKDWTNILLSGLIAVPFSVLANWIFYWMQQEGLRRAVLTRASFRQLGKIVGTVGLTVLAIIISLVIGALAVSTTRILVLPDNYFSLSDVAFRIYFTYVIAFTSIAATCYFVTKAYGNRNFICIACAYLVWLSFPTLSHWNIEIISRQDYGWGDADAPLVSSYYHLIIVPHVFVLENGFINVRSGIENAWTAYMHDGSQIHYNMQLADSLAFYLSTSIFFLLFWFIRKRLRPVSGAHCCIQRERLTVISSTAFLLLVFLPSYFG